MVLQGAFEEVCVHDIHVRPRPCGCVSNAHDTEQSLFDAKGLLLPTIEDVSVLYRTEFKCFCQDH